ncbi:hypothetical protein QEV69_02515 [Trueperella pyogenes]|uniref:SMODS domain-containing nucleotidyltransferase n=1 Tax=Trueperella pyogenes TaxID=1661 RepID=UPI0032526751
MTDVNSLFRRFEATLRMSPNTVDSVRQRYRRITWRLNQDFWEIDSEVQHSWYAGSYGRGTAISTSDIDIHFELPSDLYKTYWLSTVLGQNGPSALLQRVKTSLQKTYPTTKLRGDGQVVVVDFSDGVRFEVVPVFAENATTFVYPDTHNGGSWPQMRPKLEAQSFADLSRNKPGGLKKLCRMLRTWNAHSLKLPGQALDAMAYEYWQTSEYSDRDPFLYFHLHTRDFFSHWVNQFNQNGWIEAPGSHRCIEVSLNKIELELIELYADISRRAAYRDNPEPAQIWRLIYGDKFPAA